MLTRIEKEKMLHQKAVVVWLTGLSGSGKTTLSENIEKILFQKGYLTQILDGDRLRQGVNNNLGYNEQDREENIRRIAEISKIFLNCGIICINSFISPTEKMRQLARDIIGSEHFIEIFLSASLEVCEKRDIKGLYKEARNGNIKNFTGIDSLYEIPLNPDLVINTGMLSIEEAVVKCLEVILCRISL